MINKIVIITTAIIRPEVHTKAINSLYKSLKNNRSFDYVHIFNIDEPESLIKNGYSYNETIKNLDLILPDYVNKVYLKSDTNSFTNAYCRVWLEANKHMTSQSLLIYFEDDWMFIENYNWISILNCIDDKIINDEYFILLNRKVIDNSPYMISYNCYKDYYEYILNKQHDLISSQVDPDYIRHIYYKFYLKKYKKDTIKFNIVYFATKDKHLTKECNYSIRNYDTEVLKYKLNRKSKFKQAKTNKMMFYIFIPIHINHTYDIGRDWIKKQNIVKWKKNDTNIKTYSTTLT